ncbi:MAG TPA: NAD-dependent epimerase/dehydratase family protein [Anaerolineae bacterium]|nr:NAD-dependent epimerase/dehydratase family protein [Anaerolineae bacterium]
MKCVVLGGEGFIGSHLAERLAISGHQVTVFDRRQNPLATRRPSVQFVSGDFADHRAVEEVLAGSDVVFHLIGTTIPRTSTLDLSFDLQSNVLWTIQLLQACVRCSVGKVVFLSSGGTVYGVPRQLPIPETHPTDPISSYGLTKLVVEKYLGLFHHLHGLDYAVLRCSNAYGERQNPLGEQGAIAVFLGRIAQTAPIVIWGDGEAVRDYIYVQDIARGLELAAVTRFEEKVLNIGSGAGVSLRQLLEVMEQVTGRRAAVEYRDARSFDVPTNILDISLARRVLNWRPECGLTSGLERTWQWVQRWASGNCQSPETGTPVDG